jgi:hypothetical protein
VTGGLGAPAHFRITVRGVAGSAGQFVVETTNPETVRIAREELARPADQRTLHVAGRVARGDGGFNTGWSWHLVPGEWELVELSIELCDGTPQMVEDNLAYWVDQVGHFCPWGSYVSAEQ